MFTNWNAKELISCAIGINTIDNNIIDVNLIIFNL